MKAPKYIIKRIYLEKDQAREYGWHMKRLDDINEKPSEINSKCKMI